MQTARIPVSRPRIVTTAGVGSVGVATFFSWTVYSIYRVAAREQKRLESITKSPLLAFFGETAAIAPSSVFAKPTLLQKKF